MQIVSEDHGKAAATFATNYEQKPTAEPVQKNPENGKGRPVPGRKKSAEQGQRAAPRRILLAATNAGGKDGLVGYLEK
jgi:hypothetical protein